jgi:hypothetical protein
VLTIHWFCSIKLYSHEDNRLIMISVSRQALTAWGRSLSQRSFASASTPAMEKLSAIIAEQSQKK